MDGQIQKAVPPSTLIHIVSKVLGRKSNLFWLAVENAIALLNQNTANKNI